MATTLYLHNAASSQSGTLPSTKQSAAASTTDLGLQSANKTMDTTVGTSQASVSAAVSTSGYYYGTKFVSPQLNQTSIAANTWTVSIGMADNDGACVFPSNSGGGTAWRLCAYVWRPSTGAKVANIFDADNTTITSSTGATTERSVVGTISGSAVTCQANDVIIFEAWGGSFVGLGGTYTIYFDGTTVSNTDNTSVSSIAAYISTPENLTFAGGGGSVTCTVTAKTINYGKQIIKA